MFAKYQSPDQMFRARSLMESLVKVWTKKCNLFQVFDAHASSMLQVLKHRDSAHLINNKPKQSTVHKQGNGCKSEDSICSENNAIFSAIKSELEEVTFYSSPRNPDGSTSTSPELTDQLNRKSRRSFLQLNLRYL